MNIEFFTTGDGSHSLYLPDLNEHYHSIHGAARESRHVYIKNGLHYFLSQHSPFNETVRILEYGFGTGLNALSTYEYMLNNRVNVNFTTLEKYPLPQSIIEKLNHTEYFDFEGAKKLFFDLHRLSVNESHELSDRFTLLKLDRDFQSFWSEPSTVHVIYFDAFAPNVQSEFWTVEMFKRLHEQLKPGGVLVTYSSKGIVRRNMLAAGFKTEKLPGPPGKREMLRGVIV